MSEGGPPESAGRPLELVGNGKPRWMAVIGASAPIQNPAYRPTRPSRRLWRSLVDVARRGSGPATDDERPPGRARTIATRTRMTRSAGTAGTPEPKAVRTARPPPTAATRSSSPTTTPTTPRQSRTARPREVIYAHWRSTLPSAKAFMSMAVCGVPSFTNMGTSARSTA